MIASGVSHLLRPAPFVAIVPSFLPAPLALVIVSGAAEILGGVGLLIPAYERIAAWGLAVLFVAVFPANVNMAVHNMPFGNFHSPLLAWLRLPFQLVLIAWAWMFTRK